MPFPSPALFAQVIDAKREFLFAAPAWLWCLLLVLPLFFLRRRRGADACINHPTLRLVQHQLKAPVQVAGWLGPLSYTLALVSLIIALANPQWRNERHEQKVSGIDIMIAADLSGSMSAQDMLFDTRDNRGRRVRKVTDRLAAAKYVISDFISHRPNDRLGLVAFAGRAKLCAPLTLDHGLLTSIIREFYLSNPMTRQPGYINEDGTAIGSAIASAAARLEEREDTKSKVIILVTDGESNAGTITPIDAARQAATLGIKIFTIAIGKDDRISSTVMGSGVNEKSLREIAKITGGRYFRASSGQSLMDAFSDIDRLEKSEAKKRTIISYQSLYIYPMALACLLLAMGFALNSIRPRPAP